MKNRCIGKCIFPSNKKLIKFDVSQPIIERIETIGTEFYHLHGGITARAAGKTQNFLIYSDYKYRPGLYGPFPRKLKKQLKKINKSKYIVRKGSE